MVTNKQIGITALLLTLFGTGSYVLYENIDFTKPVYYCEERIDIGPQNCVRFSTSGTRCYPNELNNTGYKDCSIGWTEIVYGMEIPNVSTPTETVLPPPLRKICSPPPVFTCEKILE